MFPPGLSSAVAPYWAERHSVPGMFYDVDLMLFDTLLGGQEDRLSGDLLEVGAFLGKSAVVLGAHRRGDEKVWICDVFEDQDLGDEANTSENVTSYPGLARESFEANYRRFVDTDPVVIQQLSSHIREHVPDASVRFAHIDGGHLYATVKDDLENSLSYLSPTGLLAVDDIRSVHTPGVAAATWEVVARGDLFPIVATEIKLYLSRDEGTADRAVSDLRDWASRQGDIHHGVQTIRDRDVLICTDPGYKTRRQKVRSLIPPVLADRLRPPPVPHLGQ